MPPVTPTRLRSPSCKSLLTRPRDSAKSSHLDMNESNFTVDHEFYPLPLRHVKALFLHEQYRQCVQACGELVLAEPDMKQHAPFQFAFVKFYLGMAHEETARMMEDSSGIKVSAFDQAQQCYRDALSALPTAEAIRAIAGRTHFEQPKRLQDNLSELSLSQSSCSPIDDITLRKFPVPGSRTPTSNAFPRTHLHKGELSDLTSNEIRGRFTDRMTSVDVPDQDFSRRSWIASPTKQSHYARPRSFCGESAPNLPRTTSNMSVFNTSLKQGLPKTTSHSLLRPVRLGSPAKPYAQYQPVQPTSFAQRSRLPKLVSPVRPRPTSAVCETVNEDDPISPLGYAELTTASTLSPVSSISSFDSDVSAAYRSDHYIDHDFLAHLEALHTQLHTHLRILNNIRQETIDAQTVFGLAKKTDDFSSPAPLPVSQDWRTRRESSTTTGQRKSILGGHEDKQKRIIAGRGRNWTRQRFDPQRYITLAEKALAEL